MLQEQTWFRLIAGMLENLQFALMEGSADLLDSNEADKISCLITHQMSCSLNPAILLWWDKMSDLNSVKSTAKENTEI